MECKRVFNRNEYRSDWRGKWIFRCCCSTEQNCTIQWTSSTSTTLMCSCCSSNAIDWLCTGTSKSCSAARRLSCSLRTVANLKRTWEVDRRGRSGDERRGEDEINGENARVECGKMKERVSTWELHEPLMPSQQSNMIDLCDLILVVMVVVLLVVVV